MHARTASWTLRSRSWIAAGSMPKAASREVGCLASPAPESPPPQAPPTTTRAATAITATRVCKIAICHLTLAPASCRTGCHWSYASGGNRPVNTAASGR